MRAGSPAARIHNGKQPFPPPNQHFLLKRSGIHFVKMQAGNVLAKTDGFDIFRDEIAVTNKKGLLRNLSFITARDMLLCNAICAKDFKICSTFF